MQASTFLQISGPRTGEGPVRPTETPELPCPRTVRVRTPSHAPSLGWWQVQDSNLRSFRDGFTVRRLQRLDLRLQRLNRNFRAYSPRIAGPHRTRIRGRPDLRICTALLLRTWPRTPLREETYTVKPVSSSDSEPAAPRTLYAAAHQSATQSAHHVPDVRAQPPTPGKPRCPPCNKRRSLSCQRPSVP